MIIDESLFAFNLHSFITSYWQVERNWIMYKEDNWKFGMACKENAIQILYCFNLDISQIRDFVTIIKSINRNCDGKQFTTFRLNFARIINYCQQLEAERF